MRLRGLMGGLLLAVVLAAPGLAPLAAGSVRPIVVDNFNDATPKNSLGGATSTWGDLSDESVGCEMSFSAEQRLEDKGYALALDFDIESARENVFVPPAVSLSRPAEVRDQVYNGYSSVVGSQDLSAHKFMVLWLKGDAARGYTRSFRLELKDGQSVGGTLVEGVTDQWQRFEVPLSRFSELRDISKVKEWTVVFGPSLVTRKTGRIYIDDVFFSSRPDEMVRPPNRQAAARRAAQAVRADGRLAEWQDASFDQLPARDPFLEKGKAAGPADLAASFSIAWDEENLYLAVDVKDNDVVNKEPVDGIWKGDCVELYLDPVGDGFVWGYPEDFQIGFSPTSADGKPAAWAWFQKKPLPAEVRWSAAPREDGYQVEAAIPWAFLGAVPSEGKSMGFSVAVHDADAADRTKEAKVNWSYFPLEGSIVALGTLNLR